MREHQVRAARVLTQLRRGIAAERVRASGRGFLWSVAMPLTFVLPLAITFGIATVAERFATIPGQLELMSVTTTNAVYWVITFATTIMMVTAAYAHGTQRRHDLDTFLFPQVWVAALARWLFYGCLAAASTAVLLTLVMAGLPCFFPHVYGSVDLTDAAGLRFLWTVPIYAFASCGIGIAAATAIRSPAAAVAVLLFWVFVAEHSMNLFPNGYAIQAYAPFLNAVYSTGQELAFLPGFGRNGALTYFLFTTAALFALAVLPPWARGVPRKQRG